MASKSATLTPSKLPSKQVTWTGDHDLESETRSGDNLLGIHVPVERACNVHFVADAHTAAERTYNADVVEAKPLRREEVHLKPEETGRLKDVLTEAKPLIEQALMAMGDTPKIPNALISPFQEQIAKERPLAVIKDVAQDLTRNLLSNVFDKENKLDVEIAVRGEEKLSKPQKTDSSDIRAQIPETTERPIVDNIIADRKYISGIPVSTNKSDFRHPIMITKIIPETKPVASRQESTPIILDEDEYFYRILSVINSLDCIRAGTAPARVDAILCPKCGFPNDGDDDVPSSACCSSLRCSAFR